MKLLSSIPGVRAYPPDGAFYVWLDVRRLIEHCQMSSHEFAHQLLEQAHVATVPGEAFGMSGYIRLSFAITTEALERAVERMVRFIERIVP
jgi:aspartate aminotransferase